MVLVSWPPTIGWIVVVVVVVDVVVVGLPVLLLLLWLLVVVVSFGKGSLRVQRVQSCHRESVAAVLVVRWSTMCCGTQFEMVAAAAVQEEEDSLQTDEDDGAAAACATGLPVAGGSGSMRGTNSSLVSSFSSSLPRFGLVGSLLLFGWFWLLLWLCLSWNRWTVLLVLPCGRPVVWDSTSCRASAVAARDTSRWDCCAGCAGCGALIVVVLVLVLVVVVVACQTLLDRSTRNGLVERRPKRLRPRPGRRGGGWIGRSNVDKDDDMAAPEPEDNDAEEEDDEAEEEESDRDETGGSSLNNTGGPTHCR